MKIVDPQVNFWGICPVNHKETSLLIEKAARICYKSEGKIERGSDLKLIEKLCNREHTAMLEHSWKTVKVCNHKMSMEDVIPFSLIEFPFLYKEVIDDYIYIAGNYRAWIEYLKKYTTYCLDLSTFEIFNNLEELTQKLFTQVDIIKSPFLIPDYLLAYTFHYVTSRDVTHEMVRHRYFTSFAQESQRYVRYDNQDIKFIRPYWYYDVLGSSQMAWEQACEYSEKSYNRLIQQGLPPQDARVVLNNSTKTEIVITAPRFQWNWIFKLRNSVAAYPPIQIAMEKTQKEIEEYTKNF